MYIIIDGYRGNGDLVNKKAEQKQETHQRILEAAHRGFRRHGFAGAGVDGLAKEAGVTSGAFYTHFNSKAAAFQESIVLGLAEFMSAVAQYQEQDPEHWLDEFATFYLGKKRNCDLAESCALQSLTPEVGRSDAATREVYEKALLKSAEVFASGLPLVDGKPDMDSAWGNLAMLIGGVTLARAVADPMLADDITAAVRTKITQNKEPD